MFVCLFLFSRAALLCLLGEELVVSDRVMEEDDTQGDDTDDTGGSKDSKEAFVSFALNLEDYVGDEGGNGHGDTLPDTTD